MLNFTFTVKTMADVANKYAENVAGAFYADDQCIDCDLCRETAPASFKRNDDGGHTYVYKQPETPEEEALCKERSEEHTSELQSLRHLVCRLLLEKKNQPLTA